MRSTFGRSRPDKAQPGVLITSYEGALYPPRPYRYYVVQPQLVSIPSPHRALPSSTEVSASSPQAPPALVMPSVDSDTVCYPRPRAPHPPPSLRAFFECFVQSSAAPSSAGVVGHPAETDSPLKALSEPLNVMHYPRLLPCWRRRQTDDRGIKPDAVGGIVTGPVDAAPTPSQDAVRADLTHLAKVAGVPAELHSMFTAAHVEYPARAFSAFGIGDGGSTGGATATSAPAVFVVRKAERLRVCPVPRHAPPRPTRRGTKVTLASADGPQELVAAWQRTAMTARGGDDAGAGGGFSGLAGKKRGRDEIPLSELFNVDGEEGEDEPHAHERTAPPAPRTFHDDDEQRGDGDDDDADDISVGLVNGDDDDLGGLDDSGGSGDDGDYF